MPKSRKRHHSRSRSRSPSRDRSRDRDDKHKKIDVHDKDRDGKRRKVESDDSPAHKRSVSCEPETHESEISSVTHIEDANEVTEGPQEKKWQKSKNGTDISLPADKSVQKPSVVEVDINSKISTDEIASEIGNTLINNEFTDENKSQVDISDSEKIERSLDNSIDIKTNTPQKTLTPKMLQKRLESEKKRQERQREKDEKEKKKIEEKERILQEKLKKKEEKQKEFELKQKEKELKEELKRKEREEKDEIKKKEREEKEQKRKKEEQKRKEREKEKIKKQQEIEEKNKEKQKEEEKKQKAALAFANFFVAKKSDAPQEEKNNSVFMAFEVKSDMKLPPPRRNPLNKEDTDNVDKYLKEQNVSVSYLSEIKSANNIRSCPKTWPYEDSVDDDVTIIEEGSNLGETICEDKSRLQKFRAKFLKFHENRRPAYYGTWRKKSTFVTARKPFSADRDVFNYDEDSDDDWEEEEQGESLNGSDDEVDKENEDEKDDYEVDNEFFVPHGHLSDDEIDDEENARLSPESLKQKLKLLKDEFDQDMQSKTHKLKPRSIGCIWYKKDGSNVDEAIDRYLQPLAIISAGKILIKKRCEINILCSARKIKPLQDLNPEYIPMFIKVTHGNRNKKSVLIEQFMTYMANSGITIEIRKSVLLKKLQEVAKWEKCKENGPLKNKFGWFVSKDVAAKYNVNLELPNNFDNDKN